MFESKCFRNVKQEKILEVIKKEGYEPMLISNEPGHVYQLHSHPETKLLVFLQGAMEVTVGNRTFQCKPGDKLVIKSNIPHSAVVGPEGCTFFWSEKLVE